MGVDIGGSHSEVGKASEWLPVMVPSSETPRVIGKHRIRIKAMFVYKLDTARLMDENPILLRLKELEVLEKVTEKVDKLTVFGGLEGLLNDTVRINLCPD